VLVNQQLVGELGGGHPGPVGHRGVSFVPRAPAFSRYVRFI
jgi:hypothetical protein